MRRTRAPAKRRSGVLFLDRPDGRHEAQCLRNTVNTGKTGTWDSKHTTDRQTQADRHAAKHTHITGHTRDGHTYTHTHTGGPVGSHTSHTHTSRFIVYQTTQYCLLCTRHFGSRTRVPHAHCFRHPPTTHNTTVLDPKYRTQ